MNTSDTRRSDAGRFAAERRPNRSAPLLTAVFVVIAVGATACGAGSGSPNAAATGSDPTLRTTAASATASPSSAVRSPGRRSSSRSDDASAPSSNLSTRMLQFAQCMRSHGVTDFGDGGPTPGTVPSGGGSMSYLGDSFNPNSPTVAAAERACAKYAVASPVSAAGAAQMQAAQLTYARCMRAHGVPNFPDPSASGGFDIPSSIDQNSPAFQAAERACPAVMPPGVPGSGS